MLKLGALALVAVAGCTSHVDGPRPSDTPFAGAPQVTWTDDAKAGYHVEVSAALQRDVLPADQLAFVVRVGDDEVGRYPIAHGVHGTTIHQKLDLPLGDYEVELAYANQRFSGDPFRIAVVPEWGGTRQLHLFRHHGTRLDLAEHKLWVLRWWSNDAPALPWIVEWRHDGRAHATTKGRERKWDVQASTIIRDALQPEARRSIWQLGEEYTVPDIVAKTPGAWEARIVHDGAPPVSIAFTVLPERRRRRASAARWSRLRRTAGRTLGASRSRCRPLDPADALELADQLPVVAGAQQIDDGPIMLTPNAVRALFRSKQLAESWTKFLGGSRTLRPIIEQMIKSQGGPWKPDEFPKS